MVYKMFDCHMMAQNLLATWGLPTWLLPYCSNCSYTKKLQVMEAWLCSDWGKLYMLLPGLLQAMQEQQPKSEWDFVMALLK